MKEPKIWVVGAGKGGVGKTFISSSLAITLTKLNFSVLVIDFDLSGGNIHTSLGCRPTNVSLTSFLSSDSTLSNLIQPTNIPRLSFIQGVGHDWEPVACDVTYATRLYKNAQTLPFDYVIIDLGPGTSAVQMELFKNADEKFLVTSAEPTSIEKNYRFIENWFVYHLKENSTQEAYAKLRQSLNNYRTEHKRGHFSFRKYVADSAGFSIDYFETFTEKPIRLILNGSRSHQDQNLGFSIKSICNKYFDLKIDYVGYIDHDNAVWQSVRNKDVFLIEKPFTPLSGQFLSICKYLTSSEINANLYKAVI